MSCPRGTPARQESRLALRSGAVLPSSDNLRVSAMTPNLLAWAALYGWPVAALAVFAMRRSVARLARTTAWMLLLPAMFLPAGLELPFAALNKYRIALLSVAVALGLFHRDELRARDRWHRFPLLVLLVFVAGAVQTIRTNADPLTFGILRLPGLGARDLAWTIYAFVTDMYLPFAIGQRVFRTNRDLRDLFAVVTACMLIYAPLCLIEMRLSPQISTWVYGYFPHSFRQVMRGAGYRPVVFMDHGLSVAMFLFSGLCAALALHKARIAQQPSSRTRALVTGAILLLGRSLASIIYSAIALAMNFGVSQRWRARIVGLIGALVIAYPAMRAYDLLPTEEILDLFGQVSAERSASLMTRFSNEDTLLARAMQRPLFGWGGWGRSRIYHWWGELGDAWADYRDVSISDGTWIIWLGASGIVGFAASYSLLVIPLFRYARSRSRMRPSSEALVGGLAVMVALFAVDLIPNAQWDYLPIVYAGALLTLSRPASEGRSPSSSAPPDAFLGRLSEPDDGAQRSPVSPV